MRSRHARRNGRCQNGQEGKEQRKNPHHSGRGVLVQILERARDQGALRRGRKGGRRESRKERGKQAVIYTIRLPARCHLMAVAVPIFDRRTERILARHHDDHLNLARASAFALLQALTQARLTQSCCLSEARSPFLSFLQLSFKNGAAPPMPDVRLEAMAQGALERAHRVQ